MQPKHSWVVLRRQLVHVIPHGIEVVIHKWLLDSLVIIVSEFFVENIRVELASQHGI